MAVKVIKKKKRGIKSFKTESNEFIISDGDEFSLNLKLLIVEELACKSQRKLYENVFHKKRSIKIQLGEITRINNQIEKKIKDLEIHVPIIWRSITGEGEYKSSWKEAISCQLESMGKQLAKDGKASGNGIVPYYDIGKTSKKLH
jgi:hypothetical protein